MRDFDRSSYSKGSSRLSTGLSAGLSARLSATQNWVFMSVRDPKLGFHVHFCASYVGKDIANHKLYHTHVILPRASTPLLSPKPYNPNPI